MRFATPPSVLFVSGEMATNECGPGEARCQAELEHNKWQDPEGLRFIYCPRHASVDVLITALRDEVDCTCLPIETVGMDRECNRCAALKDAGE